MPGIHIRAGVCVIVGVVAAAYAEEQQNGLQQQDESGRDGDDVKYLLDQGQGVPPFHHREITPFVCFSQGKNHGSGEPAIRQGILPAP